MSNSLSKASEISGLGRDLNYNLAFIIASNDTLKSFSDAVPALKYVFLPTAAAFSLLSFGLNLLSTLRDKRKKDRLDIANLTAQGALAIAVAVGTVLFYLMASLIATTIFTVALGAMALFTLGKAGYFLYLALQQDGEERKKILGQALSCALNGIGMTVIAAGLMIAEITGITKIVNIVMAVINIPLFFYNIWDFIKRTRKSEAVVNNTASAAPQLVVQGAVNPEQTNIDSPAATLSATATNTLVRNLYSVGNTSDNSNSQQPALANQQSIVQNRKSRLAMGF